MDQPCHVGFRHVRPLVGSDRLISALAPPVSLVEGLITRGPDRLRLVLVDLKGGTELNLFERLPHLLAPMARDQESCLEVFQLVLVELQRRQMLFDRAGLEDIERWNEAHPDEPLPYVLVVIDEVAELSAVESRR